MSLSTEFERSGSWLFRYRSFLPVGVIPVLFLGGLTSYNYIYASHSLTEIGQLMGLAISSIGLGIRMLTIGYAPVGTSGRNTTSQVADKLNTTGMYSIVRHPLYVGNYLIMFGLIVVLHSWTVLLLTSCIFALFYERIMFSEEAFLRKCFEEAFEVWADKTPAFFPSVNRWIQPEISFCWRTVLRREYTGLFIITTMFSLLDFFGDSMAKHHLKVDWLWLAFFAFGLVTYLTLRTLKKFTRILHVNGR